MDMIFGLGIIAILFCLALAPEVRANSKKLGVSEETLEELRNYLPSTKIKNAYPVKGQNHLYRLVIPGKKMVNYYIDTKRNIFVIGQVYNLTNVEPEKSNHQSASIK